MIEVLSKINIKKKDKFFQMATGYAYDVEIIRSTDGGQSFWNCGCGAFAKTREEAEQIKKELSKKEYKVINK